MLNKIAKVQTKILIIAIVLYMFIAIPKVMAMSSDQAMAMRPYGLGAMLFAMGSALLRLGQRNFIYLKRVFDLSVSLVCLVLTAPLVILFSIAIKFCSPQGAILYTQIRVGRNGKHFKILKLRSMRSDAETGTGAVWGKGAEDSRCIPYIGSFLRKSHIDEIPQFVNVLMGDMSVVGPRPERPELVEQLKKDIPEYEKRLSVKPGITGLAQIRHKYDETIADVKKKVKLDLLYIRKMCLLGEFSILLRTALVVLKGKVIGQKRSFGRKI